MGKTLMQIMQPEIDEKINEKINDVTRTNLYIYVQKGKMALNDAADEAGLSVPDFSTAMASAGYKLPQIADK